MNSDTKPPKGIISRGLAVVLLSITASTGAGESAKADSGLGGGATFLTNAVFPFIAGTNSSLESGFFVQNIGDGQAELELFYPSMSGIKILPVEGQRAVLDPGESMTYGFRIEVSELVPAGNYPVTLNLRQRVSSDPGSQQAGTRYIPALGAKFVVSVVGASATANISTISSLNGEPAVGNLSLYYLAENGTDTLVASERSSGFSVRLVPGNYRLYFDIPNLQRQTLDFTISDGEVLDVVLEIPTLDFLFVSALPTRDDRDVIQFIELSMDIFNNLETLRGPIDLFARVRYEGEIVEDFVITTLTELPRGETFHRAVYNPESGFAQGDWTFQFFISNEDFELPAQQIVSVNSPGLLQSYIREVLIGLAAIIIVLLLIPRKWWALLAKKRKRDDDEDAPMRPGKSLFFSKSRNKKPESIETTEGEKELIPAGPPAKERIIESSTESYEKPKEKKALGDSEKQGKDFLTSLSSRLFAVTRRSNNKDPLQRVLELRREMETLEDNGVRSLDFAYQLDKVFAPSGEQVKKREDGTFYTPSELQDLARYSQIRRELARIETDEIRREANRILVSERIERRRSGG